jgi:TPR repeat protein
MGIFGLSVLALAASLSSSAQANAADGGAPPLTRELVVSTVKARLPEVSACYQKALLEKPWLAGRLVVSFTVASDGAVSRAEIERNELPDARFLACAQAAVKAWRFARAPGAPADFSYPFVFGESGVRDPSVLVDGRPLPAVLPTRCEKAAQCRALGLGLRRGSEADQARSFEFYEMGCALKDGASCAAAAAALDFGRGVAKDKARALTTYERACALGEQGACTAIAMSERDPKKAAKLLERACAAKEPAACLDLAERDVKRADELRARALLSAH